MTEICFWETDECMTGYVEGLYADAVFQYHPFRASRLDLGRAVKSMTAVRSRSLHPRVVAL